MFYISYVSNKLIAFKFLAHNIATEDALIVYYKKKISKWIRSFITCYYVYVAYYGLFILDFSTVDHPAWRNLENHWWKCITVWNVGLQVRYFLMSVIIDNVNSCSKISKKQKWIEFCKNMQDYCFITFDAPSSIFVCSIFWLICLVNRPLFFPAEMNTWVPDWYNHAVHTVPAPLIILQMFLYPHHNPPIKQVVLGFTAHCLIYILCILYTRWITGEWIYLVIGEMAQNILQLIVFFFAIGFIVPLLIMLACYKTNGFIWNIRSKMENLCQNHVQTAFKE